MNNEKYSYISFLQIVGPIFVILGHSINGLKINGRWYVFSKEWIYIFHMPLFFLISGYLFSFRGFLKGRSYSRFMANKFKRLLIPYLFWNLLFAVPKCFLQAYIADDTPVNVLGLLKAFLYPRQNIWGHTWFLFGLFIVYSLSPVIEKILKRKNLILNFILLLVCIILYLLPIRTEFIALSDIHKDLLFFILGCLLGQMKKETFLSVMNEYRCFLIFGAVVTSVVFVAFYHNVIPFLFIPCTFILLGLLSIGTTVTELSKPLERVANDSFAIYILHWPVMIFVRIVMYQILGSNQWLTMAAMCIMGWIIPVTVVVLLRKIPSSKIKKPLKYILGV